MERSPNSRFDLEELFDLMDTHGALRGRGRGRGSGKHCSDLVDTHGALRVRGRQ